MNSLQLSRRYRDYPDNFYPLAIDSMAPLQNGCYRLRWEIVPENGRIELGAGESFQAMAQCIPGSWLYALSGEAGWDVQIQITDVGSGLRYFNTPLEITDLVDTQFGRAAAFNLLPKRRLIDEPGKLSVDFWNMDQNNPAMLSLVLWLAEPVGER